MGKLCKVSYFILRFCKCQQNSQQVAPLETRVKHVMQELSLDQEAAKREIATYDKSLREFTRRYFKAELEDPLYYDLIINTGRCSFQAAASIIINARSFKEQTSNTELK